MARTAAGSWKVAMTRSLLRQGGHQGAADVTGAAQTGTCSTGDKAAVVRPIPVLRIGRLASFGGLPQCFYQDDFALGPCCEPPLISQSRSDVLIAWRALR